MLEMFPSLTIWFLFLIASIFLLTLFVLPRVRESALKFGYYDTPDYRSSHTNIVPTFGGVAFFIAFIITLFLSMEFDNNNVGMTLLVSLSIMFFTGLKDDLKNLSPKMKFLGQFLAVLVLMSQPDFRIISLHGLLGVYELPIFISILISMFVILGLINAFNLIDGIDGMASIVGIVIASSFGFLFYKLNMFYYLAICAAMIAMLFAFLRFNLSPKRKMFMGDTGSLLLGLVLGVLLLKLLSLGADTVQILSIQREHLPLLLVSILFIPTFDMIRVMLIRKLKGDSFFSPDRNHIHHILIDLGLSHRRASFFFGIGNIGIAVAMFYSIRELGFGISFLFLMFFSLALLLVFFGMNRSYTSKRSKVQLRKTLFYITNFFKRKPSSLQLSKHRLAFYKKLKRIRILFF